MIASRVVLSEPVFDHTQYWHYLWDEITIPVTRASDWRHAGEIMLEHGVEYSAHLQAPAQGELAAMMNRLPVRETPVEPLLCIAMTDNWIEMTLRNVVEAPPPREVEGKRHPELLQHSGAGENITVTSVAAENVGFLVLTGDA